jgi:hypothetical protein
MSKQFSVTLRNAWLATYESTISTAPKLRILTGAQPASCATAESGTLLIQMALPSDWMAAPSSGSVGLAGTWSGTVVADGTAGYYRIVDTAGTTCHEQGAVSRAFAVITSASTSAGGNVLTFTSTTGVSAGMTVSGTGITAGSTVLSTTSTTVTLSSASTAGVGSAVPIYFGDTSGDLWLTNTALTTSQTITISERVLTAPGA